jgi:hypothetical protein
LKNWLQVRIPYQQPDYDAVSILDRMANAVDNTPQHIVDLLWKAFGMETNDQDDISIDYTCISLYANRFRNCRTLNTAKTNGFTGQTEYLDRQWVFAADNEILTGFNLKTVKNTNGPYWSLQYFYSVCELY